MRGKIPSGPGALQSSKSDKRLCKPDWSIISGGTLGMPRFSTVGIV